MNSGVYCIEHKGTSRKYIGSSINVQFRITQHFLDLRCGRHANRYLQRAFDKYGEDDFFWYLLEQADENVLLEIEQKWIDEKCACDRKKGFNLALDALSPMKGRKHSEETKRMISEKYRGEKARRRKLTEEQVREIFHLAEEGLNQFQIADQIGTHYTNISCILGGKTWSHLGLHKEGRYNNTSGCVGVYQTRSGKWKAEIIRDGVYRNLGVYIEKEIAIAARKKAEEEGTSVTK